MSERSATENASERLATLTSFKNCQNSNKAITELTTSKDFLEGMRKKHVPIFQNRGKKGNINYCVGCKGPNDTLIQNWPCDVVRVLIYLEKQE